MVSDMADAPSLEGVVINVDSPQVAVDAPITAGLGNAVDDIRKGLANFVESIREGDDVVMATVLLSIGFAAVGIYLWRRL